MNETKFRIVVDANDARAHSVLDDGEGCDEVLRRLSAGTRCESRG